MRWQKCLVLSCLLFVACGEDPFQDPQNPKFNPTIQGTAGIYMLDCTNVDILEPNDSRETAARLPLGTIGGLSICGNADWFVYDLLAGETLTVEIRFKTANGDLDLELLTESERLSRWSTSVTDREVVSITASQDEVVYLNVYGWHNNSIFSEENDEYTLIASVTEASDPCQDDEYEPNDDYQSATRLYLMDFGQWKNMKTCPANPDWLVYDLSPHQLGHTVTVEVDGDYDLFINLPQNREDWYRGEFSRTKAKTFFSFRVRKPEPVYFLVDGGEKFSDYSIRLLDHNPAMEPTDLGSICGDYFERTLSFSDFGEALYRIEVQECSSMPYRMYIHAKLTLPYGVTYDLSLYDQDWRMVSAPYLTVGPGREPDYEYAQHSYGGGAFQEDNRVYYLDIDLFGIHVDEREDAQWQLDIRGGSQGF